MMNNEEFKNEVYERFEKYKAHKAEQRKKLLKYGSITLSALIVAVAVASPVIKNALTVSKEAYYADGIDDPTKIMDVDINKEGNKSAGGEHVGYNGVESENETPTDATIEATYASTMATQAATTAAATYATTKATVETQDTTVAATEATYATTFAETMGPAIATEQTGSREQYNTSPKVTMKDTQSIEEYFIGMEIIANEYREREMKAYSDCGYEVRVYSDLSGSGEKSCVALSFYGSLAVTAIDNDGKTLTYTAYIVDTDAEMKKSLNIFIFDGDREIVFDIKPVQTEKEDEQ